ncbi:hypothetical protein [Methyloglobulus morosus]|nr:hypothetical protein [Methyloglobulus morosus]
MHGSNNPKTRDEGAPRQNNGGLSWRPPGKIWKKVGGVHSSENG